MFGETAARRKEKERVISDQFADRPNFMHSAGGKELAFARPLTALLQASVHSQQSSCFESASAAVSSMLQHPAMAPAICIWVNIPMVLGTSIPEQSLFASGQCTSLRSCVLHLLLDVSIA